MLSEEEIVTRTAYDRLAPDYAEAFPGLSAETPGDRSLINSFADQVTQAGPVVDAGCGTGRVAAHLGSLGLPAVGVDLSSGMLTQAQVRHPALKVVVASLRRLPFADATAAGVVAWYSLIHVAPRDVPSAVAELSRVLKAGAPALLAFQCGNGERVEREAAFGHQVRRINYRHDVELIADVLASRGVAVGDLIVRDPVAAHETTQQAFLLGVRQPGRRRVSRLVESVT